MNIEIAHLMKNTMVPDISFRYFLNYFIQILFVFIALVLRKRCETGIAGNLHDLN